MAAPVGVAGRQRIEAIDALRGLAVLLMVADHLLMAAGAPTLWRLGPTRVALPLFAIAAGGLWAQGITRSVRRDVQLAGVGGLALGVHLVWPALGWPDPVTLWLLVGLAAPSIARHPTVWAVLGLLQGAYWPVHAAGVYEPGTVAAYAAIGVLAGRGDVVAVRAWGEKLPRWVAAIGRRPLWWYAGHLALLGLIAAAVAL